MLIKLTKHKAFDIFIVTSILANTLVLALNWYGMNENLKAVFETINYVFMFVFAIEALVKIIALKCQYFQDSWNIFDFSVVIMTGLAILYGIIPATNAEIETQATFIRILRILRVLRTIKRLKPLQIIFETIYDSLPSFMSLGALLLLFLFLFSIIGT